MLLAGVTVYGLGGSLLEAHGLRHDHEDDRRIGQVMQRMFTIGMFAALAYGGAKAQNGNYALPGAVGVLLFTVPMVGGKYSPWFRPQIETMEKANTRILGRLVNTGLTVIAAVGIGQRLGGGTAVMLPLSLVHVVPWFAGAVAVGGD